MLDVTRGGKPVLASNPVLLPEWVDALSSDPEVFQCRALLEAQTLVLAWEAHGRYSGGAPPPRQVVQQAASGASGVVRMDLETGRIETADAPPGVPRATLREADSPPASPDAIWHSEPWRTGDRLATLAMKEEGPGQSLHLETWSESSSETTPEQVELARGMGMAPSLSTDGKYVLVEPDEPEPGPRGLQWPWWIFDATTGRRVATVPHEEGAQEPCVVGPRLYYLVREPARPSPGAEVRTVLKARDLSSGALLWERPLGSPRTARAPELPERAERPDP